MLSFLKNKNFELKVIVLIERVKNLKAQEIRECIIKFVLKKYLKFKLACNPVPSAPG